MVWCNGLLGFVKFLMGILGLMRGPLVITTNPLFLFIAYLLGSDSFFLRQPFTIRNLHRLGQLLKNVVFYVLLAHILSINYLMSLTKAECCV